MNLNKIRGLRAEKGFNQQQVADKLGISKKSYGQKEIGKVPFTIQEVIELSVILGQEKPNHIFFN